MRFPWLQGHAVRALLAKPPRRGQNGITQVRPQRGKMIATFVVRSGRHAPTATVVGPRKEADRGVRDRLSRRVGHATSQGRQSILQQTKRYLPAARYEGACRRCQVPAARAERG